ncbi:9656_t:CDS:2 [Cetraspora pellucida]|uniref:9656_t:CDS:1 n=1 Tax=Cetraspora pellucida TaxID=1433469 RepID=A0A9N9BL01_9GLOM|nr:9656_t:CDS:2 [Cetraspora pellucida]
MVSEQSGVLSGNNPMSVNATDPLQLVIVQAFIIVAFTLLLHLVLKHIRQPRVTSEVIGGIILGPSALGHIPGYMDHVFPAVYLNLLANLGLVLYLFLVGLELNPRIIKNNLRYVIFISASGIILPFALGVGVAYGIYDTMGIQGVPFTSFVLFIYVAMTITAFPVLARILSGLKLMRTPVGNRALTSTVGDDFLIVDYPDSIMLENLIEFNHFSNPEKITEGGFGIICKYKYRNLTCVLKCSKKSKNCEVEKYLRTIKLTIILATLFDYWQNFLRRYHHL